MFDRASHAQDSDVIARLEARPCIQRGYRVGCGVDELNRRLETLRLSHGLEHGADQFAARGEMKIDRRARHPSALSDGGHRQCFEATLLEQGASRREEALARAPAAGVAERLLGPRPARRAVT